MRNINILMLALSLIGCAAEMPTDDPVEVEGQSQDLQYVYCAPSFWAAAQQHYIAQEVANGGNAASCMTNPGGIAGNEYCRVFQGHPTEVRIDFMTPRPITSQIKLTYDVRVQDPHSNNGAGGWKEYGWYTGSCTCNNGNTVCVKNAYSGSPAPNGNTLPASVGITH